MYLGAGTFSKNADTILNFFTYVLYTLNAYVILGYSAKAPEYVETVLIFMRTFVALLLMYFFSPYSNSVQKFTGFHRRLAFRAGVLILFSLFSQIINDQLVSRLQKKTTVKKHKNKK